MEARLSRGLFALGIVGSVEALGAIHTPVLLLTAAAFAGSAFFGWRGESPFPVRSMATLLVALAAALTAYTALQAVPLPFGFVNALSPYVGEVWERSLRPLGLPGPSWVTLSLDPVGTRIEVLRGTTYLACLIAALPIARRRDGAIFLERLLLGSALLLGVMALAHPLLGAEKVFGVYRPVDGGTSARHIAPLLDPNHLAGYLNVGLALALGVTVSAQPHLGRIFAGLLALFFVALEVWIASRGGVATMLLAVVLVALLAVRLRAHGRTTTVTRALVVALVAAVVVASFGILVLAGSDDAWRELSDSDVSKLDIFRHAMHMVAKSPLFGAGRGAFQSVFPAFRDDTAGTVTFRQPENIVAQWSAEWGVPVAALALVGLAVALRPTVPLARSRPPVGAWVALVVLFVHNLVDFSSEVPGVVVALVTCGAIVVGGSAGHRERFRLRRWSRRPRAVAMVTAALVLAAAAWVVPTLGHEIDDDEASLHQRVLTAAKDRAAFIDAVGQAMREHPAEPYFPYLGGLRALVVQDESPIPWLSASLERAALNGRAHLLLARALFLRAPAQARLEYQLAYQQDGSLAERASTEGARLVASYDDARELAPGSTDADRVVLASLAIALAPRLPATATRIDAELQQDPGGPAARDRTVSIPAFQRSGGAAVADLQDDAASWCDADRAACVARARSAVALLRQRSPDRCRTDAIDAELQLALGEGDKALDILEKAVRLDRDGLECVDSLVDLAERRTDNGRSDALLDRIANLACASGSACVETLSALSRAEQAHGRPRRAMTFAKRSYERDPSDTSLIAVAKLAASTGLHAEALEDFRRLSQRHPDDPQWAKAAETERVATFNEMPLTRPPPTATPTP